MEYDYQKYHQFFSEEQSKNYIEYILGIRKDFILADPELASLQIQFQKNKDFNDKLHRVVSRNNAGIVLERQGDIESAIKIYEENILEGYRATHSYERLMILYRKMKRYDDEIRVIKIAISDFGLENQGADDWYTRLAKSISLKAKL